MSQATTTPTAPYYVRMHDTFMSNWGHAKGKRNILVIACETWEQATAIAEAAGERRGMRLVVIDHKAPRPARGELFSWRRFSEMGGPWLTHYSPPEAVALSC